MCSRLIVALASVAIVATSPVVSYSQDANIGAQAEDIGMREYVNSCAVCHGDFGKGDGPLVPWLKQPIPDLTTLQKRNNGVFAFDRIYRIVDGREEIASHGRRDMPVWGKSYSMKFEGYFPSFVTPKQLESFVRGRNLGVSWVHLLLPR